MVEIITNPSGSLGSAKPVLDIEHDPPSAAQSCGDMSTGSDMDSLEDARRLVRDLRQKTRAQAQQIMAWRRAYKMQELLISRLQREKCDQLKALSSKLLLFESRLIRKQKDISTMLNIRENIINRQQRIIETLSNRLIDNGLEVPQSEIHELETNLPDLDSLNDSDSAVVLEDVDSDSTYHVPKFRTNTDGVTVMRSISDAIDPNLKYTSVRRNNGFLRRPEILETVYSVEEDGDNDQEDIEQNIPQNIKSFWAILNTLKKESGLPSNMTYIGNVLTYTRSITNAFVVHFQSCYNNHTNVRISDQNHIPFCGSLTNHNFTEDEIQEKLKNMNIKNKDMHACQDFLIRTIESGLQVDVIYTNLAKVFDIVCHSLLLKKLEAYGVGEGGASWISSYLTNRCRYVDVSGAESKEIVGSGGMLQGSAEMVRLSIVEYMRYLEGTESSICVHGGEVVNVGYVITLGRINSSDMKNVKLCALSSQTSA
ncbi:hypothetical protein JTB14_026733 [Gonioctena quinquepunctata]|nr:hypothetical protein JTB14_026733 [Gonioctena quinquepunctata]